MQDDRISIDELKVGDTIGIRKGTLIAWSHFRYPITIQKVIARITPKRTKIITEDGCEYDTRRNFFYKLTEKSKHETMIARYALNISKRLRELEEAASSGKLYKLPDDKIERISKLLDEINTESI